MTPEEKRRDKLEDAAYQLIREHVEDFEFSNIYEDDRFEDFTEDEQRELLHLVRTADVTAWWNA